jgi:hypothetical protein
MLVRIKIQRYDATSHVASISCDSQSMNIYINHSSSNETSFITDSSTDVATTSGATN